GAPPSIIGTGRVDVGAPGNAVGVRGSADDVGRVNDPDLAVEVEVRIGGLHGVDDLLAHVPHRGLPNIVSDAELAAGAGGEGADTDVYRRPLHLLAVLEHDDLRAEEVLQPGKSAGVDLELVVGEPHLDLEFPLALVLLVAKGKS